MSAIAPPIETETTSLQLVVFTLGEARYALPMNNVREIIRYTRPRSIDSPLPWLRGVISLRGRILPVCDLASQLAIEREHDPDTAKIVIIGNEHGTAGAIVDEVDEVITVSLNQLEAIPGETNSLLESIATIGDQLILIVTPNELLATINATRSPVRFGQDSG
jgi:purine-binding chemotaxis protein CheW